jgi:hypothetical protein
LAQRGQPHIDVPFGSVETLDVFGDPLVVRPSSS